MFDHFVGLGKLKAIAVEYGNNASEAMDLARQLAAEFPNIPLYVSTVSPVIGTHTGPNVLTVSALEE